MLEGIKEKMLELLYDIEEEAGKESKLYVHAYDVYADIDLYNNDNKSVIKFSEKTYEIIDKAERSAAIKGITVIDMNTKPILEIGKRYKITIEGAQDGM